jgi:hypothetical protein
VKILKTFKGFSHCDVMCSGSDTKTGINLASCVLKGLLGKYDT